MLAQVLVTLVIVGGVVHITNRWVVGVAPVVHVGDGMPEYIPPQTPRREKTKQAEWYPSAVTLHPTREIRTVPIPRRALHYNGTHDAGSNA